MPDYAFMYAIPYEYYEKYRIRKYGFHGTSHRFVAEKACKILNLDYHKIKIITCHLGNGASITAINNGISVDTSMGFTPVDGLIMGTRTGEIDPGVLLYLADKEGLSVSGVNNMINKKSGVAGISQLSSDMRDLETAAGEGNAKALLALNMYSYKIKKFIGAYVAAMNGIDLLIFTAGVGENDFNVRKMICNGLDFFGIEFDEVVNHGVKGKDLVISKPASKVKVMVVTTDEEFVIASDTTVIVEKLTN
jgi:acetate kinase